MSGQVIPISEDFSHPQGALRNYHAYELEQREQLAQQQHVDIRNFIAGDTLVESGVLPGVSAYIRGEDWTTGTAAKQSDRRNWRALSLTLSNGTTITAGTIPNALDTALEAVDLLTGFEDDDVISVALPSFPLATVNLATSFIDFTSNPSGNFTAGPTDSISFTDFDDLLAAGDSELRFPRSELSTIDLENVYAVRFRIAASGAATMRIMAIRLLSVDWQYGALDIDTRSGRLVSTVAPNGSITRAYDYTFPRVFRAHEPSNEHDPRPIDVGLSTVFNTGSKTGANRITIYVRELVEDFLTQIDLDGLTMAELNEAKQPNTGEAKWNPRDVVELEGQSMADLEGDLMADIERTEDREKASWFAVTMAWEPSRTTISAFDSEGNGLAYNDVPSLAANTEYVLRINVEGNSFHATLHTVTANGSIDDLVYDTTVYIDDFAIKRRKGRVGWDANLTDGDASVAEIRTFSLMFAEYRSQPLASITPVDGAQLFAEYSPDRELFTGVDEGPWGGNIVPDRTKVNSAESYKITNFGVDARQGLVSNEINFENFTDYRVEFDIWYPSAAIENDNPVELYLMGRNLRLIKLHLGTVQPDSWHRVTLSPIEATEALTGAYRLLWIQPNTGQKTVWWLDNISIVERSLRWSARAQVDDPWGDFSPDWTNFINFVNSQYNGILFPDRGKQLQVRGQALRQDAEIGKLRVVPKYTELGRIVWSDQVSLGAGPTAAFTSTLAGLTRTFNATTSTDGDGRIISYVWDFGDGSQGFGRIAKHTYATPSSTYFVTLTVVDDQGTMDTDGQSVGT